MARFSTSGLSRMSLCPSRRPPSEPVGVADGPGPGGLRLRPVRVGPRLREAGAPGCVTGSAASWIRPTPCVSEPRPQGSGPRPSADCPLLHGRGSEKPRCCPVTSRKVPVDPVTHLVPSVDPTAQELTAPRPEHELGHTFERRAGLAELPERPRLASEEPHRHRRQETPRRPPADDFAIPEPAALDRPEVIGLELGRGYESGRAHHRRASMARQASPRYSRRWYAGKRPPNSSTSPKASRASAFRPKAFSARPRK